MGHPVFLKETNLLNKIDSIEKVKQKMVKLNQRCVNGLSTIVDGILNERSLYLKEKDHFVV